MSLVRTLAGLPPETPVRRVQSVLSGSKNYWEVFDSRRNEWHRLRVFS